MIRSGIHEWPAELGHKALMGLQVKEEGKRVKTEGPESLSPRCSA